MILLSILIPSIPSRCMQLDLLLIKLRNQIGNATDIEVLIDDSKEFLQGGLSIGKKREGLVQRATGKYLCFLDDDDDISGRYISELRRFCLKDPDVVTFRSFVNITSHYMFVVSMSLQHTTNEEASPVRLDIERRPWHICPVRSEYAKRYSFEDINYGEDFQWMDQVLSHCLKEEYSIEILHMYTHTGSESEADKITNNGK